MDNDSAQETNSTDRPPVTVEEDSDGLTALRHLKKHPPVNRWLVFILVILLLIQLRHSTDFNRDAGAWGGENGLRTLATVHEYIRKHAYEVPTDEELFRAALNGMMQSVDRYSHYAPPFSDAFSLTDEGGSRGLIGIIHAYEEGMGLRVSALIPGFPAAEAGVQEGDIIVSVDGTDLSNFDYPAMIKRIAGGAGDTVELGVRRGRERLTFELMRRQYTRRAMDVNGLLPGTPGIGYIRFGLFTEGSAHLLHREIRLQQAQGMQGLILDLRENPGGLLEEGLAVADMFLKKGTIVTVERRTASDAMDLSGPKTYSADADVLGDFPLVVLVNRHTASSAEIVTGALKYNKRAHVIGERTYGKGRIQDVVPLPGEKGEINLTVGRYLLPDGKDIDRQGILPHEKIDISGSHAEALMRYWRLEAFGLTPEEQPEDPALRAAAKHMVKVFSNE